MWKTVTRDELEALKATGEVRDWAWGDRGGCTGTVESVGDVVTIRSTDGTPFSVLLRNVRTN